MKQLEERVFASGSRRELVLHGAGAGGELALEELRGFGFEPTQVFDSSTVKQGTELLGLPITEPVATNALVLISSMHAVAIAQQHRALGNDYLYFGPCFERERFFEKIQQPIYQGLREKLIDLESQLTLDGLARFRETLDPLVLRRSPYDHFQHPEVRPRIGEHVVDAGAWEGDTTLTIHDLIGSTGSVTCFEPSARSASQIPARSNIVVREQGLWSENCYGVVVDSERNSTADQIQVMAGIECDASTSEGFDGEHRIELVALDAADLGQIDVIKMDIEGAEGPAIRGAEETIKIYGPRLMISVYHRFSDLWEIPTAINEIRPYKFFLGHHTDYAFDTVLYAIPA